MFHYHHFAQLERLENLVNKYIGLPGFASLSDIAIVGGGFGWTAELLAGHGINAISIDVSPYIIDNESISEEAELRTHIALLGHDPDNLDPTIKFMSDVDPNLELTTSEMWVKWLRPDGVRTSIPVENEDLANPGSRNKVKQRLGNNMDAILTEDALEGEPLDSDALTIIERCEQLRPNPAVTVIHLITGAIVADARLNSKTGADWRAFLDANGFNDHWVIDFSATVF